MGLTFNKNRGKKGELTSTQLASIIIVIVGFAILIFALYKIFYNDSLTDRETCRLSVVSRATVPSVAAQAVPLNCFTEKVCITVDKGIVGNLVKDTSCKQFAGEKNVRTVKVKFDDKNLISQNAIDTIQREVANAMFDCWTMTGQGKMDIFSKYSSESITGALADATLDYASLSLQDIKTKCVVCSRVAFSDALIEADKDEDKKSKFLKNIDYNSFMSREKVHRSSLTYFQAFTDEGVGSGYGAIGQSENKLAKYYGKVEFTRQDVDEIKKILLEQAGSRVSEEDKKKINDLNERNINDFFAKFSKPTVPKDNQVAIVFAQIKVPSRLPEEQFWNTLQNGAMVGGFGLISGPGKIASFLIPGAGWVKALALVIGVGATSLTLAFEAESIVKSNQALSAATCGDFQSTTGGQKGCSLVKLVNWDVKTMNDLCVGGIEGNL